MSGSASASTFNIRQQPIRFYPLQIGFGPQVHADKTLACARKDKKSSFNANLIKDLQVRGCNVRLIVSDGYRRARHPLALDLTLERLELFNKHASDVLNTSNTLVHGLEKLYHRVKDGIVARIADIKEVEKEDAEGTFWEYSPEEKVETINTIQDCEWLPELHSTVIAMTSNQVIVVGPGAFAVALVGPDRAMWLSPKGPGINVVTERIWPEELLLVLPPSLEVRGISLIARRVAQQNYDVVRTAEELSDLDPAVEDSTVLVVNPRLKYLKK